MTNALRNFKVPEETIRGLSFDDASQLLDKYIGAIRAREKKKPDDNNSNPNDSTSPGEKTEPKNQEPKTADLSVITEKVRNRLRQAKEIMKAEFGMPEYEMNPDSAVLGEVVKQIGSEAMILEIADQKRQNIHLAKQVL
jgi:hypothetical protein